MIRLILEAVKEWVEEFAQTLIDMYGLVFTYDTMPSDDVLLAMPNNTEFVCRGYYDKFDRCGGRYRVTINWNDAGKTIGTKSGSTVFLIALNDDGSERRGYLEACRYGIRSSKKSVTGAVADNTNTFGEQNSTIFGKLRTGNSKNGATIVFPEGIFFFATPISNADRQLKLKGVSMPLVNRPEIAKDSNTATRTLGTVLAFPWLANGQYAISWGSGTIENISIVGNPNTYDITFDRTKIGVSPNEIYTETIAENDNAPIKCTGLKSKANVVKNVNVAFFNTGIEDTGSNSYYTNIYGYCCNRIAMTRTDTKWRGVYGWHVHTGMDIRGSLVSVVQMRLDNCVHAVAFRGAKSCTVLDVDADICVDSLVAVYPNDLDTSKVDVKGIVFQGHGRCNVAKAYNKTVETTGIDIRTIENTDRYGLIRAYNGAKLSNSQFTFNAVGNYDPYDATSNYLTPNVLFTLDDNSDITNNTFVIVSDTDLDFGKDIQRKTNNVNRLDTPSGTFFVGADSVEKFAVETALA